MSDETKVNADDLPPDVTAQLESTQSASPLPMGQDQDPESDVEEIPDDELEDVEPDRRDPLDEVDPMLAGMCGDGYADMLEGAVYFLYGHDVSLPDDRLERRGMQIAYILRREGWDDDEIVLFVAMAAGVVGDVMHVRRELETAGALEDTDQEDDDDA